MRPKLLGKSHTGEELSKPRDIFVGDEFIFSQKHKWIMLGNGYEFCAWEITQYYQFTCKLGAQWSTERLQYY